MTTYIERLFTDDLSPLHQMIERLRLERETLKAQRIAEANTDTFDGLADRFFQLTAVIEADLKAPDITDAVNFTDELTAIEKLQREIEQIADKFGTGSAGSALYGDWSEPSDAYKAAQPYHNDLYPY